jgi:uncharacterized protein with HEPN domain
MRFDRTKDTLLDMRDNLFLALEWTGALSLEAFAEDQMRFYAVTRCLEIISEASRRLPDKLYARHPAYAWRQMQDAGNVYRHQYDGVTEDRVLESVRGYLPALLAIIEAELSS